jgi:hypothetical protein
MCLVEIREQDCGVLARVKLHYPRSAGTGYDACSWFSRALANIFAGIDKDTPSEDLCEFDIEIRRRLWTILFIWDW